MYTKTYFLKKHISMKSICSIFFYFLFLSQAICQVNIESFRNSAKNTGFFGETRLNIEFQKGNVNSKNYEIAKDLHYKYKKHHVFLKGAFNKGYQDEALYKNTAFSHFRYTLMLQGFLGYEIFTQTQYDEFKDLSLRQLNGGGIRIEKTLSKNNLFKIAIGIGLMSDYEQLTYESTVNARGTSYISILKDLTSDGNSFLSVITYYQPLLFNHKDYRINNEINLRSSIINIKQTKIGLNTSFNYLYDTVPAVNIEKTDIIIKTGLVIVW